MTPPEVNNDPLVNCATNDPWALPPFAGAAAQHDVKHFVHRMAQRASTNPETRPTMNKLLLAVALAASFGVAHAGPTNLVVDGSFEDQAQAAGSWNVYNKINGWTTVSGSGIELRDQVAGNAFDGKNYVELDSYNNSAMAQTLTTTAGSLYTLSFAYSARAGVDAASNPIEVLWNGLSVATVTGSGLGQSGNVWSTFNYAVTGTGSDVLTFRAMGTNDSVGGSLDAVSVSAVPEASTYAMMFFGLVAIGFSVGRRRTQR
jgi:hypothetical protein